jgi:hypothetical protein
MSIEDREASAAVGPHVGSTGGRDNVHPLAATKHAGYSKTLIAKRQGAHLDRLREQFPTADVTILGLQASRLAQLELVGEWLDGKGIIRNKRFGTVWPAAEYWGKVASAFERQHERLEAQARETGVPPGQSLAEITAELAGEGE